MTGDPSKEQILQQQKDHYHAYLKINNNPRYKHAWNFIARNAEKNAEILDIGCADGGFSEKLIGLGYPNCYGLEITEDAIIESSKKGVRVVRGSFLDKFPFQEARFDIIFAGEVIEHTIDDDFFLAECHRCLKRGGYLILTTPNLVSLGNRILMLFGKMPRFAYSEFHYRIYNEKLIADKIKKAGFDIIEIGSNYILISTFFNKIIGTAGEFLGKIFPSFGENLILYGKK